MKKLVSVFMLLCMCWLVIGCGKEEEIPNDPIVEDKFSIFEYFHFNDTTGF